MNPDGLYEAVGTTERFTAADVPASSEAKIAARFNANDVDLNRNFDCEWQETGMWQAREVSGGSAPFSEPESKALRNYVESNSISAAVVWYSSAGGVYSSRCGDDVLPETTELADTYADAAGYPAYEEFDYYKITGDMVNWLAKNDIPAISVLLTTHDDTEWSKNRAGATALMNYLAN
jgi:hypothetical protein